MSRLVTFGALKSSAIRRANKQGDSDVAANVADVVAELYTELYECVVDAGERYFETKQTIATDGSASYTEPSDILSIIGVDRILDTTTGRRRSLMPFMVQERDLWAGKTGYGRVYGLVDDQLYIYPQPTSGQTYELLYVPQAPDLATYADTDNVDVVCGAGLRFMRWGIASVLHGEGETDVQLALRERDRALSALADWARERYLNESPRMIVRYDDVRDDRAFWDDAGWWNR